MLVGDHRQPAAVGAGRMSCSPYGSRYEPADARRFDEPWEREASLRLRIGDEDVFSAFYHRHGRILDAGNSTRPRRPRRRPGWLTLGHCRSCSSTPTSRLRGVRADPRGAGPARPGH
ncbi:AAA family ATPase [Pseudonocardia sp. MCCB 268]|nr:AAA family ATPase [Pseudonocardia cytotoxica]